MAVLASCGLLSRIGFILLLLPLTVCYFLEMQEKVNPIRLKKRERRNSCGLRKTSDAWPLIETEVSVDTYGQAQR